MILSIGEILADVVMNSETGEMRAHVGGAPFNVAVSAAKSGARTVFLGRVGNDPLGKFVAKEGNKFPLGMILQKDDLRPTTIAFVSIDENGERSFRFTRENAADYHIEVDEKIFKSVRPDTVHLGSLMLSEEAGRKCAYDIVSFTRKYGAVLSFDVNYREDVFKSADEAKKSYMPFIKEADILKFSREELELFYENDYLTALGELENPIVCVTCGKDGSIIRFHGKNIKADSVPVKPVDTTGAGDAFFGAFLAKTDGIFQTLTEDKIFDAARYANIKGAEATMYEGAVKL